MDGRGKGQGYRPETSRDVPLTPLLTCGCRFIVPTWTLRVGRVDGGRSDGASNKVPSGVTDSSVPLSRVGDSALTVGAMGAGETDVPAGDVTPWELGRGADGDDTLGTTPPRPF